MFRLSDSTRRLVATGLFVLLCVVPTVVLIGIGLWRCLPGRVAAEERRLSLLIGQPVRIENVRYLSPGAALYRNLEVLDPESGEVLLHCDWLRIRPNSSPSNASQSAHSELDFSLGKLTVRARSAEAFRGMADRLLQQRIDGLPASVHLADGQLALENGRQEFPPCSFRAKLTFHPQESKVELYFQQQGQTKTGYVSLIRSRKYQPPVDGFLFVTGDDESVPCGLVSTVLPAFPELGPGARFEGGISGSHVPKGCRLNGQDVVPEGWWLAVKGSLQDIDLGELVGNQIPHEVSGVGTLQLKQLDYRAGRIQSMDGVLGAQNGRISRTLVASCMAQLGFKGNFLIGGSNQLLAYDQLAVQFHLDGAGLVITGVCPSEPPGAVLTGGYVHRLDGPDLGAGAIRPTAAIAALTSTPEDQLSTSPHAIRLLQHVPLIPTGQAEMIAAPHAASPRGTNF
ncbi:MAG: hypothetical protein GXX96_21450 [Planctomycetaceae bacterium]|mgnify:CR=1 FL=1|nr:hypothetical protein [Planctomycetaceae bacterium]